MLENFSFHKLLCLIDLIEKDEICPIIDKLCKRCPPDKCEKCPPKHEKPCRK